jgi:16S rRNA (cytidine1402-2'-O)-methyltransferase
VAREVTKLHEEFRRAPLDELAAHYVNNAARGEIVIVIAPPAEATTADVSTLDARLAAELQRHPVKDAAAIVAAALGLPRRDVYARALELRRAADDA